MKKIYTILLLSAAASLSAAAQRNFSTGAKAIMGSFNSYLENPTEAKLDAEAKFLLDFTKGMLVKYDI